MGAQMGAVYCSYSVAGVLAADHPKITHEDVNNYPSLQCMSSSAISIPAISPRRFEPCQVEWLRVPKGGSCHEFDFRVRAT